MNHKSIIVSDAPSPLDELSFQHTLIDPVPDHSEVTPTFAACLNAHGQYETMRFVLRLSPRNHELMQSIEESGYRLGGISFEAIQAYSTYIHETVHWWQHVGSTSGLLLSLSYLAQCHSSMAELQKIVHTVGLKKPLKAYTDQVLRAEGPIAQEKLASANIAVNNAIDVEHYKAFALDPNNITWLLRDTHFECIGHNYFVVYSQLLGMLADTIDPNHVILPKTEHWDAEISKLREDRVDGYYWQSPVSPPIIGLKAVFEGQARFCQLQFLHRTCSDKLTFSDWKTAGYLAGIYMEAFDIFLKLSESEVPGDLGDPIVGLFLLVCDLAINPTRGVPLEITNFSGFIESVDVGVRFTALSQAVHKIPHLKTSIIGYTRAEYLLVSEQLTKIVGYDHPIEGLKRVRDWIEMAPGSPKLMKEYGSFDFDLANLPLRVFISHFIAFYNDKLSNPEFFCWPGIYTSTVESAEQSQELWLRHLSLFGDRGDKNGVFPRQRPGHSEESVRKTFNLFYGNMVLYDLTRQWILADGPFVFDSSWLYEHYDKDRAEAWGSRVFEKIYGVALKDFQIVQ